MSVFTSDQSILRGCSIDVDRWVFEMALPYWAEHGVDRRDGGFVEYLNLEGHDGGAEFKRVRAQARQIYVFAHAALLGWQKGEALAQHGWTFLSDHARRADGAWVRQLSRTGEVLDPSCDAYDMAFVLFAHAWMFRLTGDSSIHRSALKTLDALESILAHPSGVGYYADESRLGPRQQNPHMHLLEAAIELADATGDQRFGSLAEDLIWLCREKLIEREQGVLGEYYSEDWSAPADARGHVIEPGHMLEWSWILRHGQRLLGLPAEDAADLLYRRGLALGELWNGLVVDRTDAWGTLHAKDCRAWPQTEALKAHLAAFENGDGRASLRVTKAIDNLLTLYLNYRPAGCWVDRLDSNRNPQIDKIPSTTFYHLFFSFSELRRVVTAQDRGTAYRSS